MTPLDEIAVERRAQAALLKAARNITRKLNRDRLAERASAVRGSGGSAWISNAALRDLCDAVALFDEPVEQEGQGGGDA